MITNVFSIYDSKAGAYIQPFFMRSVGEALRALQTVMSDPTHQFARHAADFTLFHLGSFDDSSAKFECLSAPRSVVGLLELSTQSQIPQTFESSPPSAS